MVSTRNSLRLSSSNETQKSGDLILIVFIPRGVVLYIFQSLNSFILLA